MLKFEISFAGINTSGDYLVKFILVLKFYTMQGSNICSLILIVIKLNNVFAKNSPCMFVVNQTFDSTIIQVIQINGIYSRFLDGMNYIPVLLDSF